MTQNFTAKHTTDQEGRPAGGHTTIDVNNTHGVVLQWQDGPLRVSAGKDIGGAPLYDDLQPNGLFVETLIAVAADRIRYYQRSEFACRENAMAITKLEEAVMWLNERTKRRTAAGIEGTHGKDPKHEHQSAKPAAVGS